MMEVYYYHVQLPLHLDLYNQELGLDYLPPRASLITNTVDHPQKTRCQVAVHSSTTDSAIPLWKEIVCKQEVPKLITNKEQILKYYPHVFEGIGELPGPPYHIQHDPGVPPKQTPFCPVPVPLKEACQQEVTKNVTSGSAQTLYKKPHHGLIALFL